jgi:hypothetical protein
VTDLDHEPTAADWADAAGMFDPTETTTAAPHLAEVTTIAPPPDPQMPWAPVALDTILQAVAAGETIGPQATLMPRTDGVALLYPGELHSFAAEPESGKTWLLLAETARLIAMGARVLFVDFEDSAANVVARLLAVGATPAAIVAHFAYVNPDRALLTGELDRLLTGVPYTLAVLDGMSEAYSLCGLDPYSNADAAKFLQLIPRPIATRGAAVALIDHVVKDSQARGRFALGAGHKLAGVSVAYGIEVITPPSRSHTGQLKILIQKDRHGRIREHAGGGKAPVIALAHIAPQDAGARVTVTLTPPDDTEPDTGAFRPTNLMEKVSRYVADHPGATRNQIKADVPGNTQARDLALQILVDDGYLTRTKRGQAHHHTSLRAFPDDPTGPPVPTGLKPVPETGNSQPVPRSHPPTRGTGQGDRSAARHIPGTETPQSAITADTQDSP